jgi:hypothetical protein
LTRARRRDWVSAIPAHFRASTGGHPGGGAGSGSCGRDLSPRSRATSGFPVLDGHYDPLTAPCVGQTGRGGAPRGERPLDSPCHHGGGLPRGRGTPRQVFLRAYVTGTPRCGDPHRALLGASSPLARDARQRDGMKAKPARKGRETCRDGEALLSEIVNRKARGGARRPARA